MPFSLHGLDFMHATMEATKVKDLAAIIKIP